MSEAQDTKDASSTEDSLTDRHDRILQTVPKLFSGDTVQISMLTDGGPSNDERTLTVDQVVDDDETGTIRGRERDAYVLSGYGTEYRLSVVSRMGKDRVELSWKSRPCGRWVKSVEVIGVGGE